MNHLYIDTTFFLHTKKLYNADTFYKHVEKTHKNQHIPN